MRLSRFTRGIGILALAALVGTALAAPKPPKHAKAKHGPSRAAHAHRQASGSPKVIEWGFDSPTTADLRKNIAHMETLPFDGVVLHAIGWSGNRRIDLDKQGMGHEAFTRTEFGPAVDDLKATAFHRFTDNFLRFNVTPGDVDWFDDDGWKAITTNAALAGWICKEGNLKGIMFDTEQYNTHLFYYQKLAGKSNHSFEDYQAEARKRGQEFARALTSDNSDMVIMFTYATSSFTLDRQPERAWSDVGLLPAFVDGMLEGADPHVTFVDGVEKAYPVKDRAKFDQLRKGVRDAKKESQVGNLYSSRMNIGFGLWLDYYSGGPKYGWSTDDTSKNYFQPDDFRKALQNALSATDKYVWIYTERINWWTGKGVSQDYLQAIAQARAAAGAGRSASAR